MIVKSREYGQQVKQWQKEQPSNPFLHTLPTLDREVLRFARIDRQTAALTAVKALRSLLRRRQRRKAPAALDEITETPAPQNPATGKPFDIAWKMVSRRSPIRSRRAVDVYDQNPQMTMA